MNAPWVLWIRYQSVISPSFQLLWPWLNEILVASSHHSHDTNGRILRERGITRRSHNFYLLYFGLEYMASNIFILLVICISHAGSSEATLLPVSCVCQGKVSSKGMLLKN
jgi:hypothetical protein